MDRLKKYLVQVFTSSGYLEREVVEYGRDVMHVKTRLAEKYHRHESFFTVVGEI